MRLGRAIDLYLGEAARAGLADRTRWDYQRYLFKLADHVEGGRRDVHVAEVTTNDCRSFLDRWVGRAPSTVCSIHSALNGFFNWRGSLPPRRLRDSESAAGERAPR